MNELSFGIIQVDSNGKVVFVNDFALQILSSRKEEIIDVHYSDFSWSQLSIHGEVLADDEHSIYRALTSGAVTLEEVQGAIINGSHKFLSVSVRPLKDESNVLVGALCSFSDVTARVELENSYRKESDRYKILLENLDAVVWESELGSKTFTYISPQIEQMLGFTQEDWLKDGFWQSRIFEEDRNWLLSYEASKSVDASKYQLEYRLIHEDGSIVWIEDLVEVVLEEGALVKTRGLMVDITDKKRSQQSLVESEQRHRQMIDEAPYGIAIYDRNGIMIETNSRNEEMWGFNRSDYLGKFNLHKEDLFREPTYHRRLQEAFRGEAGEVVSEMPLPDGNRKWFRIKYYPLLDSAGSIYNVVFISEDISKYINSQNTLHEERALKKDILDALDDAVIVVDRQSRVIDINQSLKRYIRGKEYENLAIGKSLLEYIDLFPEKMTLRDGLKSILQDEQKLFEHEIKLADGKWYNLRVTPLQSSLGAVIAWQNINTKKQIEIALERSLEKYRNLYNRAPVMMHSIDKNKKIISVSDFWLEKLGYERNEVIGKFPWNFLTEESQRKAKENIDQMLRNGSIRDVSYTFCKRNGDTMEVVLSAVVEYDENHHMERAIAGMLDVTELRKAEHQLQDSQAKLLEAQSISKIANYEYDITNDQLIPSQGMVAMFGMKEKHFSMAGGVEMIHPDDIIHFKKTFEKSASDGTDFSCTYRIYHQETGQLKWIAGRGKMLKDENGLVARMIGTVQEITEQKMAEERIKRLTDRVLLATEIAGIGVWEYDKMRNEIYWGDQMYTIFSDCDHPIIGMEALRDHIHSEDQLIIDEGLQYIEERINFFESEFRIKASGSYKYVRAFTRINRDDRNKMIGLIGVVYDITPDKTLQEKLKSSLREKDVLIKEVHHRVKNNLQLISSILALKSYDLQDDSAKVVFDEVNGRIKAMSVIHDKLYTFYNVSEIDIREYLNHIASELQVLQANESLRIRSFSDYVILDVEKALLIGLTVSELVVNAAKHSFAEQKEGTISIHFTKVDKKHILRVLNDGTPVPENVLDRKSSGLGVSLVKTFVNQLGGDLSVDSENGFRATF